jgi:hypothetical protein
VEEYPRKSHGVGGEVRYRRGLPRIPGTTSVAAGFPCPAADGRKHGQCEVCGSVPAVDARPRSRPERPSGTRGLLCGLVSSDVVGDHPEERGQRVGDATSAEAEPGRDLLAGRVEVDECYIGGLEEGLRGRLNLEKTLIVVAAQEDGPGIGRIRMRQIVNACLLCKTQYSQAASSTLTAGRIPAFGEQRLRARGHVSQGEKEDSIGADAPASRRDLSAQTLADRNPSGSSPS